MNDYYNSREGLFGSGTARAFGAALIIIATAAVVALILGL